MSYIVLYRADRDEDGVAFRVRHRELQEILNAATKRFSRKGYFPVRKLFSPDLREVQTVKDLEEGGHLLVSTGERPALKNKTFWNKMYALKAHP